jgi:hypothetical protein
MSYYTFRQTAFCRTKSNMFNFVIFQIFSNLPACYQAFRELEIHTSPDSSEAQYFELIRRKPVLLTKKGRTFSPEARMVKFTYEWAI